MRTYYNIKISDFHNHAKKGTKTFGGTLTFANHSMSYIYSEVKNKFLLDEKWTVHLSTTSCYYGGVRHWFVCPYCGERKSVILFHGGKLACRECIGFKHTSLNRTKTDYSYYFEQAKKEAQKIDNAFKWESWQGDGVFPPRPKNMHHDTYWKKREKYMSYVIAGNNMFSGRVKGITKKYR